MTDYNPIVDIGYGPVRASLVHDPAVMPVCPHHTLAFGIPANQKLVTEIIDALESRVVRLLAEGKVFVRRGYGLTGVDISDAGVGCGVPLVAGVPELWTLLAGDNLVAVASGKATLYVTVCQRTGMHAK